MDWIQLVLPTEGMQAAILAYRDSFAKDDDLPQIDWDRIEQDYFGWLDQQKDQMLGLNGKTEMVYFAVDPEDRIAASVHLYENAEKRMEWNLFLCPTYEENVQQLKQQVKLQLEDWGLLET